MKKTVNSHVASGLCVSELVELAYNIAKEQYKNEVFSFTAIWSKVWKAANNFSKEKVENWIGYFYSELSLDARFSIFGFNKWKLREYMTSTEIKKIEKKIFADESVFEEEYEAYLKSVNAKKEIEVLPDVVQSEPETISNEDEEEESETENKDDIFEEEE